jgi:hypothetical protein
MRNQYGFTEPPRRLRRPGIKLDNFSLVPASLLPDMSAYQTLSDSQPNGTAVMVLPSPSSSLRRVYAAIARSLKDQGKTVRVYSPHIP